MDSTIASETKIIRHLEQQLYAQFQKQSAMLHMPIAEIDFPSIEFSVAHEEFIDNMISFNVIKLKIEDAQTQFELEMKEIGTLNIKKDAVFISEMMMAKEVFKNDLKDLRSTERKIKRLSAKIVEAKKLAKG